MYNTKDIQFAGKHDFDQITAELFALASWKSFSVGIFRWVLTTDGKSMKRSKCIVRVSGPPALKEKVFKKCTLIVKLLDDKIYDGRKNVTVR